MRARIRQSRLFWDVSELGLILSISSASAMGTVVGFTSGLVPGLHMNNIAAAISAYSGVAIGLFGAISSFFMSSEIGIAVSCFISSALMAHTFAESITSTYIGIPAEDVVSVLPAHRLAKAGLGALAVQASADGALVGVVVSSIAFFPLCAALSDPVNLYAHLRKVMFILMIAFSIILVASEGFPSLRLHPRQEALEKVLRGAAVFVTAGLLGTVVLKTNFFASHMPDFPWMSHSFVPRSSLLLPMFAGLFGVSGLILSLGSRSSPDITSDSLCGESRIAGSRDIATSILGGAVVGWMPGMTSGSAVTLLSPTTKEPTGADDIDSSVRFIWLYSSITASGAVFAVGALFGIMRARSGSMDAISFFMAEGSERGPWHDSLLPIVSILLSMLIAGLASHAILCRFRSSFFRMRKLLCSRPLAVASLAFVCSLSIALTGSRGLLLLVTATSLGLIPPIIGVRRILLMGSLLVPIVVMYLGYL